MMALDVYQVTMKVKQKSDTRENIKLDANISDTFDKSSNTKEAKGNSKTNKQIKLYFKVEKNSGNVRQFIWKYNIKTHIDDILTEKLKISSSFQADKTGLYKWTILVSTSKENTLSSE